jgi:hypothetical protein
MKQERATFGKQNGESTHRVDLRFWGAQAASLFISAACRDALRLRRGDVLEGCRQAAGNYRLAACAPQNQLAPRKIEA